MEQALEWVSEYGSYLLIPFISALAGWGTNWLAIKMTFYPIRPIGKFPLGWQGVVPSQVAKFAGGMIDTTIGRLGGIPAIVDAVDMNSVKKHLVDSATPMIAEAVHGIMRGRNRVAWENLPAPTKKMVFKLVEDRLKEQSDELAQDIHDNFERLLDLREHVVRKCERNPDLLNKMFFSVASKELNFLITSGFLFGFVFGVVQALVWFVAPKWWVLPFFGLLVGTLTNWIAIQLIFTPLEPIKIGPFIFQGLFLRRQREISMEFSRVFTEELLTASEVVHTLIHGPRSERTLTMLRPHISEIMESKLIMQLATQAALGPDGYGDLQDCAPKVPVQYPEQAVQQTTG